MQWGGKGRFEGQGAGPWMWLSRQEDWCGEGQHQLQIRLYWRWKAACEEQSSVRTAEQFTHRLCPLIPEAPGQLRSIQDTPQSFLCSF